MHCCSKIFAFVVNTAFLSKMIVFAWQYNVFEHKWWKMLYCHSKNMYLSTKMLYCRKKTKNQSMFRSKPDQKPITESSNHFSTNRRCAKFKVKFCIRGVFVITDFLLYQSFYTRAKALLLYVNIFVFLIKSLKWC